MQAHEVVAGLINPDGVEGIELVEGSLLSALGSVISLSCTGLNARGAAVSAKVGRGAPAFFLCSH